MLHEGDVAPDFTVKDTNGKTVHLSDFRGQHVVLYFYPKDMTPGCTVEACQFSEDISAFTKRKAVVLGVSLDSEKRHQKFTEKHNLQFPLLADVDMAISKAYGVYGKRKFMGVSYMGIERTTFIIDKKGKIAKIFLKVKADGHSKEVLETLNHLVS